MAAPATKWNAPLVIGLVWGALTLVGSFYFGSEDHQPGEFFIERQALWNGGTYYVKFTFLMVWLTLFDVVGVPLIVLSGFHSLATAKGGPIEPPPTWDTKQTKRRVQQFALAVFLCALWGPFTLLAVMSPQKLDSLGFLASMLLMIIPIVPLLAPAVVFDLLLPVTYLEGQLTSLQVVKRGNNVTAYATIGTETITTSPAAVAGLRDGMNVGLLRSGFFGATLRMAEVARR